MTRYEYQVVPFQGQIKSGGSAQEVSVQLQNLVNQYATQGWELFIIQDVKIQVTPGCLASLFGAGASYISYDQIIFRRPV
jgi:hypothetical protein